MEEPTWKKRYAEIFSFLKPIRIGEPGIYNNRSLYVVLEEFLNTVYTEGLKRSRQETPNTPDNDQP